MPYLQSAQSWLTQSTLLLQARPTTTRITTKYNIAHTPDSPHASSKTKARASRPAAGSEKEAAAPPVRASLTLKTYDPVSGATLKYTTTKAAEVSRLIQIMGRLARPMAGLPEVKEEVMADVEAGEGTGTATPVVEQSQSGKTSAPGQTQGSAGGKKGKKKGKK